MEHARDLIREGLHKADPVSLPLTGTEGSDLYALCMEMFKCEDSPISKTLTCLRCNTELESENINIVLWDCSKTIWKECPFKLGSYKDRTISEWIEPLLNKKSAQTCAECHKKLTWCLSMNSAPEFMVFSVYNSR